VTLYAVNVLYVYIESKSDGNDRVFVYLLQSYI